MADSRYAAILKPYYTLSEASSFLERRIVDVVRDVLEGKIKSRRKDKAVRFAVEDLLQYQGYFSLSSACDALQQELGLEPFLSRSEILALERENKRLDFLVIKKQGKGSQISSQTYVSQKSLQELIHQLRTGEVWLLPAAKEYFQEYLQEKLKEKGYSPITINFISSTKDKEWQEKWRIMIFPEEQQAIKRSIDDYCASLYDPAEYLSLPEAAQLFYQQLLKAGINISGKVTPRTLALTFRHWSRQGKLPTKIFCNPFSDHYQPYNYQSYIRKEDVIYLIEQHQQAGRNCPKARMFNFRQLQYRELLRLVNTLRKDVEQVSGMELPPRIFLAKPSGTYASINYKKKERYNYGNRY